MVFLTRYLSALSHLVCLEVANENSLPPEEAEGCPCGEHASATVVPSAVPSWLYDATPVQDLGREAQTRSLSPAQVTGPRK